MRIPTLALTLALLAAAPMAPAVAQRASLAERVAALEQRAANNQGNVDLLNQVSQLKSEVTALRSQIEELQQQGEQAKSTSQSQYLDLDGRLNRLEGGAGQAASSPPPADPALDASSAAMPEPPPADTGAARPGVYGDPGALAQNAMDERASYEAAFDVLKAGRYDESARVFKQFLQSFPNGTYAPNARYWLGESYYVTQNYALALEQFKALYQRYPAHEKAAGALLKIGLSEYGLKQMDASRSTLAQVVQKYPGTDAARTADDRLRAMELAR